MLHKVRQYVFLFADSFCFFLSRNLSSPQERKNTSSLEIFDDRTETILSFVSFLISGIVLLTVGILLVVKNDSDIKSTVTTPLAYTSLITCLFVVFVLIYTVYRTSMRTKTSHNIVADRLIRDIQKSSLNQ